MINELRAYLKLKPELTKLEALSKMSLNWTTFLQLLAILADASLQLSAFLGPKGKVAALTVHGMLVVFLHNYAGNRDTSGVKLEK